MPRGISAHSKEFYYSLRSVIEHNQFTYNQKDLALKLNVSPTKIHRFVVGDLPWREAFVTNHLGGIGLSGIDISREFPNLRIEESSPRYDNDPSQIKKGYEAGDPFEALFLSAQAAVNKAQGKPYQRSLLLTGRAQRELVESATHFMVQLNRQLSKVQQLPNFGTNEWWLDYVEQVQQ